MIKYNLAEEEIRALLISMAHVGPKNTYEQAYERFKALSFETNNIDLMCLDMHEVLLSKARSFSAEDNDKESQDIKNVLYQLASIFRILAHKLHKGTDERNKRFIELVYESKSEVTYRL